MCPDPGKLGERGIQSAGLGCVVERPAEVLPIRIGARLPARRTAVRDRRAGRAARRATRSPVGRAATCSRAPRRSPRRSWAMSKRSTPSDWVRLTKLRAPTSRARLHTASRSIRLPVAVSTSLTATSAVPGVIASSSASVEGTPSGLGHLHDIESVALQLEPREEVGAKLARADHDPAGRRESARRWLRPARATWQARSTSRRHRGMSRSAPGLRTRATPSRPTTSCRSPIRRVPREVPAPPGSRPARPRRCRARLGPGGRETVRGRRRASF